MHSNYSQAFRLPDEELCTEEHAHTLQAVAAKGDDPASGVVAAAGPGVHSQKTVVGLACWISRQGTTKANLTFSLPGAAVAALAFLPGHTATPCGWCEPACYGRGVHLELKRCRCRARDLRGEVGHGPGAALSGYWPRWEPAAPR